MPTTLNRGVTWTEVTEQYGWGFDTASGTASRGARVTNANLNRFVEDMLGYSAISNNRLIRHPPESHPRWNWLYCQKVEFMGPFGEVTENAAFGAYFGETIVKLTYMSLPYEVVKGGPKGGKLDELVDSELYRYIVKTRTFTVENIPVPGKSFEYLTDAGVADGDIPENPPKLMMSGELQYQWVQIPAVFSNGDWILPPVIHTAIKNTNGKVNSAQFDGRYDAETLLMLSPHVEPTRMSNGRRAFDITYKFAIRDGENAAWNKIYRSTTNTFRPVRRKNVGPPNQGIYQTATFETLFTVG